MNFKTLSDAYRQWKKLTVIDRSFCIESKKYYILCLTQTADKTALYILEQSAPEPFMTSKRKYSSNRKSILNSNSSEDNSVINIFDKLCLGNQLMKSCEATSSSLRYYENDPAPYQLFFHMIENGWKIPSWLQNKNWQDVRLCEICLENHEDIPDFNENMPMILYFRDEYISHTVKKSLTLKKHKPSRFSFVCNTGEKAVCYINDVLSYDPWIEAEKRFSDPRYCEHFTEEQLAQVKNGFFTSLEKICPKGMEYPAVYYECDKPFNLSFYSKSYLNKAPESSDTSICFFVKPEHDTGTHSLPLRVHTLNEPVHPDFEVLPAELLYYQEKRPSFKIKIQ